MFYSETEILLIHVIRIISYTCSHKHIYKLFHKCYVSHMLIIFGMLVPLYIIEEVDWLENMYKMKWSYFFIV
jgi:hypothetical protein